MVAPPSRAPTGGSRSSAFDRAAAPSLGARPARWEAWLLVVLAVATWRARAGSGSLLLVALILAPGAAALNLAPRLPVALALAAGLAALAGVAGLLVSYHCGARRGRVGRACRRRRVRRHAL